MLAQLDVEYLNGMIGMFERSVYASEAYLALAEEDAATDGVMELARQTIAQANEQLRLFQKMRGSADQKAAHEQAVDVTATY